MNIGAINPLKYHILLLILGKRTMKRLSKNKALSLLESSDFLELGERADDVIKRIISKDRKEWIVVSNDRDIVNHAWAADSIPVPSEKFFDIVSRHAGQGVEQTNEETADELFCKDFEEDEYSHASKGNPYQLSKKEKAIRRALSKL